MCAPVFHDCDAKSLLYALDSKAPTVFPPMVIPLLHGRDVPMRTSNNTDGSTANHLSPLYFIIAHNNIVCSCVFPLSLTRSGANSSTQVTGSPFSFFIMSTLLVSAPRRLHLQLTISPPSPPGAPTYNSPSGLKSLLRFFINAASVSSPCGVGQNGYIDLVWLSMMLSTPPLMKLTPSPYHSSTLWRSTQHAQQQSSRCPTVCLQTEALLEE